MAELGLIEAKHEVLGTNDCISQIAASTRCPSSPYFERRIRRLAGGSRTPAPRIFPESGHLHENTELALALQDLNGRPPLRS
jgi:hypothetical protein